ncbi:NAD(P)/FAD-dependent oxidoreductase [Mucilaginibacter pocheonensis]|uniref:FAD-dependent dehydrogenase n=1 Tax=Mucilaginibacter pocheonensis TaxID=398050 RepID=A0ABU1T844_9SPHI|nr:FAD-dependent oxidoreductase [Mucilaginibacter pocheonensis]MDR6941575.1 putative FAD-dependent dehydrogenase [Mucilaginibacter pocheonensis]
MIKETEIVCPPGQQEDESVIIRLAAASLNIQPKSISAVKIVKRSIDARGRKVVYRMQVQVFLDQPYQPEIFTIKYPNVQFSRPVIIVGAGPAGLFAALQCIQLGLKPVVVERGKDVKQRRRDLANINKQGLVNTESNYCFGEGGAGTYSDGKLYTRSTKRGDVNQVLKMFVAHGADESILIDARPHIGTNKLPQIITAMRESVLNAGGEILFDTRVTALLVEFGKMKGVKLATGEKLTSDAVILATGHSARDVFEMLHHQNILIEAKPFALGVRIEHPQEIIDRAQYHCEHRGPDLPPSYYNLVEQVDDRGVFSFCMCPGGIIAPCATEANEIVVNGWSPSKRNNPFANSGTVVQINMEDVPGDNNDPFKMLRFQQQIEHAAFLAGGGKLVAPGQRMVDFVEGRLSNDLPANSYLPGTRSVELKEILPLWIHKRLQKALPVFGKKMKGYYTNEAILVGVESRTSSPVKVPRDKETLQHPQVAGLFPCGEGAGYAGGIISAAIDGINCALATLKILS